MGATLMKTGADLRRRKLQSAVLAFILFLAGAASTLALDILVASRAPFDAAFARANGAHLVIDYDSQVPTADLVATGAAAGVTASAGPWPVAEGAVGHPKGGLIGGQELSGRPQPDATLDAITVQAGRWWQSPGEVVLDQDTALLLDLRMGDTVTVYPQTHADPKEAAPAGPVDIPQAGRSRSLGSPRRSARRMSRRG
jgi:putative ABC transport system permease protein